MYAKLLTYSAILYEQKNFCGWVPVQDIHHTQAGIHLLYLLLGNHLLATLFPLLVPRIHQSADNQGYLAFHSHQFFFNCRVLTGIRSIFDENNYHNRKLYINLCFQGIAERYIGFRANTNIQSVPANLTSGG
jgi:hypothetical protein